MQLSASCTSTSATRAAAQILQETALRVLHLLLDNALELLAQHPGLPLPELARVQAEAWKEMPEAEPENIHCTRRGGRKALPHRYARAWAARDQGREACRCRRRAERSVWQAVEAEKRD